jgi:hypothetical protein
VIAMRILILLLTTILVNTIPTAFSAEAQCQCVCRYGPNGRVCRQVCAPRVQPQPYYTPRYDPQPQYQYAAPSNNIDRLFDDAFLPLVIALVVAGIVALVAGNSSTDSDIAKINASTAAFHAEGKEYEAETQRIHEDIARHEHAAFREGRADAERDWYASRRR